jgi:hypothetical protein
MIHLTLTGVYAGQPFCNCNKEDEINKGNKFYHYGYIGLTDNQILVNPDICNNCKKLLKDVMELPED